MDNAKVKVRILPLKGIGGVGNAGDVVWMSAADAEMYVRDGYVVKVEEKTPAPAPAPVPPVEEEHHVIIKPAKKRK